MPNGQHGIIWDTQLPADLWEMGPEHSARTYGEESGQCGPVGNRRRWQRK